MSREDILSLAVDAMEDAEAKGLEKAATAYTSGPWSRFADDLTVIAGGVVVGTFHPETPNRANTNGTPLAEAKANAKLAAASPEMLRTLKMVRPTFEELFPNGAGTACIRAAIASAEGAAAIRSLAPPAYADAEAKGDGRAFFDGISNGFITLTSGDGNPYIKISYRTLKDAQDAHGMLIAAIRSLASPAPKGECQ